MALKHSIVVRSRGFSLTELLVVIGLLIVLAAILLPTVSRALRQADEAETRFKISVISQALDTYHNDFKAYPNPGPFSNDPDDTAAKTPHRMLVPALLGPVQFSDSGVTRFKKLRGRGEYLSIDDFKPQPASDGALSGTYFDFHDTWGEPIRYFPRYSKRQSAAAAGEGYLVGKNATGGSTTKVFWYDTRDWTNESTEIASAMRVALGDYSDGGGANGSVNEIDRDIADPEVLHNTGEYILWSGGPDRKFFSLSGTSPSTADRRRQIGDADEIFNFEYKP